MIRQLLKIGDTIGVIAPSSPVEYSKADLARQGLLNLGFKVKMGKSCYSSHGYLAGSDALRASDVNSMFLDESIQGILCLRGGYGASRILHLLDYDSISKHPKVFIGFSDITALHIVFNQICGFATYHGPMVAINIADSFDPFSKESLLNAITSQEPLKILNPSNEPIPCLAEGEAAGEIVGGNLSLISASLGTPYEIDTRNRILFLEGINERPYRVDRMLTQLFLSRKLDEVAGILLGDWSKCEPLEGEKSLSLMDVFRDRLLPLKKPVLYHLKTGHCKPMITLPLGVKAYMNASEGVLVIE